MGVSEKYDRYDRTKCKSLLKKLKLAKNKNSVIGEILLLVTGAGRGSHLLPLYLEEAKKSFYSCKTSDPAHKYFTNLVSILNIVTFHKDSLKITISELLEHRVDQPLIKMILNSITINTSARIRDLATEQKKQEILRDEAAQLE